MKYSFKEFLSALESEDFDKVDNNYGEKYIKNICEILCDDNSKHYGDCTKHSITCYLCNLQYYLEDYKNYFFDEEIWRKENGK